MVLPSGVTVRRTTNTIFPSRLLVCSTVFRSISFTATIRASRIIFNQVVLAVEFSIELFTQWCFRAESFRRASV